jgi:hypothetical protein
MYHILPPQRQRQYGPFRWKNQSLALPSTDSPRLIELAIAILTRIGRVDEKMNFTSAERDIDLFGAGKKRPRARLKAQAVERRLTERSLDPLAEIGGNGQIAGLESTRQCSLELSLALGGIERPAINADPGASPRRLGANVRRDLSLRPQGQTDQVFTRFMRPGKDALAFGRVPSGLD